MAFDPHKPARTRDGRPAHFVRTKPGGIFPHLFCIRGEAGVVQYIWVSECGVSTVPGDRNLYDLENYTPDPTPQTTQPPAFDPAKPVQTRDGRRARILCTDRKSSGPGVDYPILALVHDHAGYEQALSYTQEGKRFKYPPTSDLRDSDLVNVPEEHTVWLAVRRLLGGELAYEAHATEELARGWQAHSNAPVACFPVTYREGTGLPDASDPK